uniref:leucine-rich repeat-containing protein 49 isoform X2 n=1 Tax=Myxine glutinosa TaxID=7769 RepID=UPI00358EC77D
MHPNRLRARIVAKQHDYQVCNCIRLVEGRACHRHCPRSGVLQLDNWQHCKAGDGRFDVQNQVKQLRTPGVVQGMELTRSLRATALQTTSLPALGDAVLTVTGLTSQRHAAQHSGSAGALNQVAQSYVPGEQGNIIESSSSSEIPIVYRTFGKKPHNPDRLNLDRRGLTACPQLHGEQKLALLNLQHNRIPHIQHLSQLQCLVLLDLYANQLEEISGLGALSSLRVLMLGRNKIKRIANLEHLNNLDVLDLHGNQITCIENLTHLTQLRVLNLSWNQICHVENLHGLNALNELNLRRNVIIKVEEVDQLPGLQHLFLSHNHIARFEDVSCASKSPSLIELALDGNPLALESCYRSTVLQNLTRLQRLDMKHVTEEERRMVSAVAKRQEERKRELHKQNIAKEKRQQALRNVAQSWEQTMQEAMEQLPALERQRQVAKNLQENPASLGLAVAEASADLLSFRDGQAAANVRMKGNDDTDSPRTDAVSNSASDSSEASYTTRSADISTEQLQILTVSKRHLAEIERNTMRLYGTGALEIFERNLSMHTSISAISFHYIHFDDIIPAFSKITNKLPSVMHIEFAATNLHCLQQLNALARFHSLEQLTISSVNPIVSLSIWRSYAIFHLQPLGLSCINEKQLTVEDIRIAKRLFEPLSRWTSISAMSPYLGAFSEEASENGNPMLTTGKDKEVAATTTDTGGQLRSASELKHRTETTNYLLSYRQVSAESRQIQEERLAMAHGLVEELAVGAANVSLKAEALQDAWPQLFIEMVTEAALEMWDVQEYARDRLHCITGPK